jgi:hypothetical protein
MNEINENALYQIHIEGHLDPHWSEWFDEMEITPLENGATLISGHLPDQAALHGLLAKIRDLNLRLISIARK